MIENAEARKARFVKSDETTVLVMGTADWNQAIATNQHYVVRELCAQRGAKVVFLESLGLRRPTISARDLARIWQRLKAIAGKPGREAVERTRPQGLVVVSAAVLPFHKGLAYRINRLLLRRQLRGWLHSSARKVLWTYTPVTYGLEDEADFTFYHCVDLLGEFPGIDPELIHGHERALAARGTVVAGSSEVVRTHLKSQGFADVLPWDNVADTQTVAQARPQSTTRVPGRILFAGNLTANKVDFALLTRLAREGFEVRVAGPKAEGGGDDEAAFSALIKAGATHLGLLSLPELASELSSATVGLIPYLANEYTRGVSPLKTYEYLAAGLAVVSMGVPSVQAVEGHVMPVGTPEAFVEAVRENSAVPSKEVIADRIAIADEHSWSGRGDEVRRIAFARA